MSGSRTWFSVLVLVTCVSTTGIAQASLEDEIFEIVDSLHQGEQSFLLPEPVRASSTLDMFYSQREYAPAWEGYDFVTRVLAELAASHEEGLNPEDYHYSTLVRIADAYMDSRQRNETLRAQFDVLLSDGVLLYARHLQEGKVDPARMEATWNFSRKDFSPERVSQAFAQALVDGNVVELLQEFKPDMDFYQQLKAELARYRKLAEQYNFQTVPDDTTLRPGMAHPNVVPLRTQLQRLGLAQPASASGEVFDDALGQAVQRFQGLHALDADGIVGRNSFTALNVSYSDRVEQLRLNLDRVRWLQDDLSRENLLVVNIPGYALYYFRDDALHWQTDVMVGTIRTQTPIFNANMTYLVLNPTWTVPRSIIRRSLFDKFQADPDYVTDKNYKLYDSDGVEANPATMDWDSYSRNRFPYRVVQQPGKGNAMGQVKFMFPNKYAIYLHDTPSRALFSRTARAFSAGCIRVRDPLDFAEVLLHDDAGWTRDRIDQVLEVPEQKVVRLKTPVNVALMYWTASPNTDGSITLHPDVYSKDAAALALLEETPRWDVR